jgi:hypothetical protein
MRVIVGRVERIKGGGASSSIRRLREIAKIGGDGWNYVRRRREEGFRKMSNSFGVSDGEKVDVVQRVGSRTHNVSWGTVG